MIDASTVSVCIRQERPLIWTSVHDLRCIKEGWAGTAAPKASSAQGRASFVGEVIGSGSCCVAVSAQSTGDFCDRINQAGREKCEQQRLPHASSASGFLRLRIGSLLPFTVRVAPSGPHFRVSAYDPFRHRARGPAFHLGNRFWKECTRLCRRVYPPAPNRGC